MGDISRRGGQLISHTQAGVGHCEETAVERLLSEVCSDWLNMQQHVVVILCVDRHTQ